MRYLIDFVNSASEAEINQYLADNNCVVIKTWNNYDRVYLVETSVIPGNSSLIEAMVEEVELKVKPLLQEFHTSGELTAYFMSHSDPSLPKLTIDTTSDKDWWKNYTYQNPVFDQPSYQLSRTGHQINVYLMDSGIESSHPEFSEANISYLYSITPGNYNDSNGHGTALGSVIVGKTCGITNAKLKIVKIFDSNHNTLQSEFLSALDAIISDHVEGTLSVLNCSWIIEKNEWIENKLRIMNDSGIHIVAAAGNYGTSIEDVTPAAMVEALTVGAYNKDLTPCDFSDYTGMLSTTQNQVNHGELDGWAPGQEIWAAGLNGTYGYVAGTSIATAISSAVLASNMSWFVNDTGMVIPPYNVQSFSSLGTIGTTLVFRRQDLLDYPDPKYNASKNLVATWRDRPEISRQHPDQVSMQVRVNQADKPIIIGTVFSAVLTKKIEWLNPLPEHFICNFEGKIVVNPTTLAPLPAGNEYVLSTATFNRTNVDDSVELVTISIYTLPEIFDPNTLPPDDPIINVLLQGTCSAPGACGFSSLAIFCGDSCTGGEICCQDVCGKYQTPCECGFSCDGLGCA